MAVVEYGAERMCLDAALRRSPERVREIAATVGSQAVVGVLPLAMDRGTVHWYDYQSGESVALGSDARALIADGVVSEIMIVDWRHEGLPNGFDLDLVRAFPRGDAPLIAFGGLSDVERIAAVLGEPRVAAVGVGNFLNYSEHAAQHLKRQLAETALRPDPAEGEGGVAVATPRAPVDVVR